MAQGVFYCVCQANILHFATLGYALNIMETLTEEVVSESSENSANIETPADGNVSMAELADQLLASKQAKEAQPEASTEETDEPAEETAEPTEVSEETQSAEDVETEDDSSPPPQPSEFDLSKYNIDLDNLSEEESRNLAKALNASAVKRFGRLTAQKKALLAENAELQAQAEQAQQVPNSDVPAFLKDNALHNVTDIQSLTKEVENLNTLIEWAEDGMDNEVQYDDNGNEYVLQDGDKTYTKADLKRIRANAKNIIRKDAPARQKWIQERAQSDQQALQTFQFLGDAESDDYKLFMTVKQSPMYKPFLDHMPNSNFALGLMVEGLKAVKARQSQQAKPTPKPKAPVASTEAGTAKAKTPQSKKLKAVEAAKKKYEASGSMADYQQYLKLKKS